MSRKNFSTAEVLAQIVDSDNESIEGNIYGNESDFETEYESEDLNSNDAVDGNEYDSGSDSAESADITLPLHPPPKVNSKSQNKNPKSKQKAKSSKVWVPNPPTVGWTRDIESATEREFSPITTPGPKNIPDHITDGSSPLQYFSLLWDEGLWNLFFEQTKIQVARVTRNKPTGCVAKTFKTRPLIMDELKAFFGLRVAMEMLVYKDRYEYYWKMKDTRICQTPGFSQTMSRDRFLAIWSTLHCVDEDDPDVDKTDKIYKARPAFDYLLTRFKYFYVPDCEMSLDEGMIPTKNKLSFKQYIKDKPIKWGIKTYLLCDSKNGYICNAEVYTGRREDAAQIDNLGVTGNLVARLTDEYSGQNYSIYTDRFYTTVQLAEYLLSRDIRICGTAMTNRTQFPKSLVGKHQQMLKGQYDIICNGSVAAIVWKDKRPIYFLTTIYISSPDDHVLRYDPSEHRRIPVCAPKAVKVYNDFMGGTDKNDQMTRLQKCRRHYKWPRRLIMKFFMWAAYNAFILMGFSRPHATTGRRSQTFHSFIEQLCEELVGDTRSGNSSFGRRVSDATCEKRLNRDAHHDCERPAHATTNQRCKVCREKYLRAKSAKPQAPDSELPKRHKTTIWCNYCEEFLCIGKVNNNCWYDWHHKVQYWR